MTPPPSWSGSVRRYTEPIGERGAMRTKWALLVVAGLAAVIGVAVVISSRGGDDSGLVVPDDAGDCREAGRDWGEQCQPGADVESVRVSRDGDSVLIDIALDRAPSLGPDVEWGVQFNAASTSGKVCGLSNVGEAEEPGETAIAYGFDPAFGLSELTRQALPAEVCRATLDGTTVGFIVDMSDQDPTVAFRVVGVARLEYPGDPDRTGTEDDFGFEVVIADL